MMSFGTLCLQSAARQRQWALVKLGERWDGEGKSALALHVERTSGSLTCSPGHPRHREMEIRHRHEPPFTKRLWVEPSNVDP